MLKILPKDARLWSFWGQGWLCVPVTIGWTSNGEGLVCGRLGYQLEERLSGVLSAYGRFCQANHQGCVTYTVDKRDKVYRVRFHDTRLPTSDAVTGVVLVPTRPLDKTHPELSWKNPATWERVRRSLIDLRDELRPALHGNIYLPMLGLYDDNEHDDVVEGIEDELSSAKDFMLLTGENDAMIPPRANEAPGLKVTSDVVRNVGTTPVPALVLHQAPVQHDVSHIADEFEVIIPRRST